MGLRARWAAAVALSQATVGAAACAPAGGPRQAGAHDCERIELTFPTSTTVFGMTPCQSHDDEDHLCVDEGDGVHVAVCREVSAR